MYYCNIYFLIVWIDELKENVIDLSLKRMNKFIEENGKPDYKIIHVGGTNGKGSVCHFIGNILGRKYKVGVYTSPHLKKVNERIVVDGKEIKDEEIEKYSYLRKYEFTYFEALTATAILHFEEKNVDYAVFEVGLGGRYDATNVLNPELVVITNVSKEHEKYLGSDIRSIAMEKAGIIKNSPVITACRGEALDVIRSFAEKKKVELYVVGEDVIYEKKGRKEFLIKAEREYEIKSPMEGDFQGENIAISVKAGELLGFDEKDIIDGIENTKLRGRMERIGKFILDGCHNPHAVKVFSLSLKNFDYEELIIIFGVMKDKNVPEMIKNLPDAKYYIAVSTENERSLSAKKISQIGSEYGKNFFESENLKEAIKKAESFAGKNDIICIVGSLYLVGEALKILNEKFSE